MADINPIIMPIAKIFGNPTTVIIPTTERIHMIKITPPICLIGEGNTPKDKRIRKKIKIWDKVIGLPLKYMTIILFMEIPGICTIPINQKKKIISIKLRIISFINNYIPFQFYLEDAGVGGG
jgi:hypothetical protein